MIVAAPEPVSRRTRALPRAAVSAVQGALELLPIPATLVSLKGDGLSYDAANKLFVRENFGELAAMEAQVLDFLRSDASSADSDWQAGAPVERRHYRMHLARVAHRADPACLVTLVDQTAELRIEDTLRREMSTDSLSGLPNRSGFTDFLEATVASGVQRWAVLMIDLERFSRVNACLGSMAGDELIITVARRIKGALRAGDVLARTGGDEFGILLAIDADASEADYVANRIRGALLAPFRLSEYEIRVSCAIGIAAGDATTGDPEDVIRHAQVAMKKAKESGRTEFYQPRALDSARAEFAMETALRRAIENDALTLVFQPICDLATGRVDAFEALARWTDERGVAHDPKDFIPVAEESGLIVPLGRWAIAEAMRTLAAWDVQAGGDCGVSLAVNLSPLQLQRDTVADMVSAALQATGLSGRRLKMELTESAIIADPDGVAEVLMALKALGCQIAMDDFGTGFSNLASLQKLPIDVLKIDRSFVTGLLDDRDKIAIVRAILGLAQALGMATVAEGIEAPEVGGMLAALGCTWGQGYSYSRPLPADAAYAFLRARNA